MRAEALAELRRMKGDWEETAQRRGADVLAPLDARDRINECVHKLLIATGEVEASYFETSRPFAKTKSQGRPSDGFPVGFLVSSVERVLRKFDDEP